MTKGDKRATSESNTLKMAQTKRQRTKDNYVLCIGVEFIKKNYLGAFDIFTKYNE